MRMQAKELQKQREISRQLEEDLARYHECTDFGRKNMKQIIRDPETEALLHGEFDYLARHAACLRLAEDRHEWSVSDNISFGHHRFRHCVKFLLVKSFVAI